MGRTIICLIAIAILVALFAPVAQSREVKLDYNDGEVEKCDRICEKGDIYSMRFDPHAPSTIKRIRFFAEDQGKVEVHLWPDDGGLPDVDRDLMDPLEVEIEDDVRAYWVELEELNITIDPPLPFHVGFVRLSADGGKLCMDATPNHAMRNKYFHENAWEENYLDWFVRVYVDYYDEPTEFTFSDATASAGLEAIGSRMAWGDFDNDDDQDLLMSGKILYQNNGDGTFTDVSVAAGIDTLPSNGGLWADFDNDGYLDFFAMVSSLEQYDRFLLNNQDGTFTDITDSALLEADRDLNPTEGAAWGDFDKDGYLDVYLANYEMPGEELSNGTRDKLYRNNGDGTFTDVADSAGIDPEKPAGDYECGRGVNWGDFNDDGWPDIYVSNYRLDPNFLYLNNGDGTFTDVALEKGVQGYKLQGYWGHTIGSAWGDFNNDGFLDLFTANLAHPRFASFSDPSFLYLNNGPPDYDFTDFTAEAQVIYIETNSEPCIGDWNNDGWTDLLVTNVYERFWQQLYRNDGDATLTDVTYYSGLDIENGWGAAFADYDQDGTLDLVSNKGLWQNMGNDNRWLKVKLTCTTGDPFCIGARVEVQTAHDKGPQAKEVASGKGTTNSPPFVLHYGLNQCETAWRVTAKFLNGKKVTLYEVDADQTVTINEDDLSDTEPAAPSGASTCAEVDYTEPTWPPGDDDDDDNDTSDDDDDDTGDDDTGDDDDNNDDDDGCGC